MILQMPRIPKYIRRACTSNSTEVGVGKDGVSYSKDKAVVDTACVKAMMEVAK